MSVVLHPRIMASHRPVSPMPFYFHAASERTRLAIKDGEGHTICHFPEEPAKTTRRGTKDVEYLVHAANAYPKLVEALKHLTGAGDLFRARVEGTKLLAKLGEE